MVVKWFTGWNAPQHLLWYSISQYLTHYITIAEATGNNSKNARKKKQKRRVEDRSEELLKEEEDLLDDKFHRCKSIESRVVRRDRNNGNDRKWLVRGRRVWRILPHLQGNMLIWLILPVNGSGD